MSDEKLAEATRLLSEAIKLVRNDPANKLSFAALSKAFEVCFEYAWKYLKRCADRAGMEVYSPRDALKAGAQLRVINDLELWDTFLNARNQSLHDYIGIADKDFFPIILRFEKEAKALIQ